MLKIIINKLFFITLIVIKIIDIIMNIGNKELMNKKLHKHLYSLFLPILIERNYDIIY